MEVKRIYKINLIWLQKNTTKTVASLFHVLTDFIQILRTFIASNIDDPKSVLDLGAGTGILTSFWYQNFSKSNYTLVDIAEDMLRIARERFYGMTNIEYLVEDYTKKLPNRDFDLIISALSIHHLEHAEKIELFKRIFEKLPVGGVFVNYDQFCAGSQALNIGTTYIGRTALKKADLVKKTFRFG